MKLMKMTLNLFTSSFILASNFECTATPITSQEIERDVCKSSPHSINSSTIILHQGSVPLESSDIQLQENTFNQHTPVQFLRVSSCVETLADLAKREKYIIALSLLPLVQAETSQAETIATNFYGAVLPTVIGASVLSAIIAPTIKDCIYRSYNKLMSSQFDKLHNFIDTTAILRWPHESLRWGYFAILRGNRDIGEWSKKRISASPPRTARAPLSAYGSPFKLGPRP